MGFGLQQAVMFMLAVNMHQGAADLRQQIERTKTAVEINAIFPRATEDPLDHQLAIKFEAGIGELCFDELGHAVEQSLDCRFIFARGE